MEHKNFNAATNHVSMTCFLPIKLKTSHFLVLRWVTIIGEFYLRSFSPISLDVVLTKSLVRGLVKESAKFPLDLTNEIEMITS